MKYRHRLLEDTPKTRYNTNTRTITKKKKFRPSIVPSHVITKCLNFAYNMAKNSLHRENRSGGTHHRTELEVFWDTFSGKVAEYIAYLYYEEKGAIVSELDFNTYNRGKWDSFDMSVNNLKISIKSTKHIGQLLLLETSDWNESGKYIPDLTINYDYFLLIRTKIDYEKNFKKGNLPEIDTINTHISNLDIQAEVTGLLSHFDFVNQIIKFRYIIKQGHLLQSKIPMDATNYYIHAYDLESPNKVLNK